MARMTALVSRKTNLVRGKRRTVGALPQPGRSRDCVIDRPLTIADDALMCGNTPRGILRPRPRCHENPRRVDRRPGSVESRLGTVTSRTARIALITVGVIALIVGGVFTGQGLNLIPGSFMTGDRMWLAVGLVVAILGVILIVLGLRRPGRDRMSG